MVCEENLEVCVYTILECTSPNESIVHMLGICGFHVGLPKGGFSLITQFLEEC